MTISSLQDLNTYAQTPITYDDVRTAQVIFDRGATVDQTLVTPENGEFVSPWGINIETITQPDVAEVEYHLDYSAFADPISITWSYLPAHMSVTRTNNTWIVSGIENSEDWLYARAATVLPPFGFSGVVAHSAAIHYYSDTQDSTKNIAAWDINLTVTQVEYFSVPAPQTYVSNTLYSQLNTCRIVSDPEDFDPVWDLRIYSADENLTPVDAIEEMFSDGSAAEATWNNSLNQYIVTGDTGSINEVLDTIDLETGKYAADFKLVFRLANNFTSDLEYQIQTFSSRDFISDPVVATTQTTAPNYIFGGFATPVVGTTTSTIPKRFRDLLPTALDTVSSIDCSATLIADPDTTISAEFSWYYPYYLLEAQTISSLSCAPISVYNEPTALGSGDVFDTDMLISTSSGFKVYDLENRTFGGVTLTDGRTGGLFASYNATALNSQVAVIGDTADFPLAPDQSNVGVVYHYSLSNGFRSTIENPDVYDNNTEDLFGYSVDVSKGDFSWFIVGAPLESNSATDDVFKGGAAYIFNTDKSVRHSIPNPAPAGAPNGNNERFGHAVSISDDYAMIAAPQNVVGANTRGSVYVYDPDDGSLLRTIDAPTGSLDFGTRVKVSNNLNGSYGVIVDDSTLPTVYVYDLSTGNQVWKYTSTSAFNIDDGFDMDASISYVAFPNANASILVFDITDGTLVHEIKSSEWPSISSIDEGTVQLSDSHLVVKGVYQGGSSPSTLVFSI